MEQIPHARSVPAALPHQRRKSAEEAEGLQTWRGCQRRGHHAVIAFDDGERRFLIKADQQNGTQTAVAVCQLLAHAYDRTREIVIPRENGCGMNALCDSWQGEAGLREVSPVCTRKYPDAAECLPMDLDLPPFRVGR